MSSPSNSTRPGRRDVPGDRVDERRLAGAVGPDQADERARLDDDVDAVVGPQTAERDGEVVVSSSAISASRGPPTGSAPVRASGPARRPRSLAHSPLAMAALAGAMPSGLRMAVRIRPIAADHRHVLLEAAVGWVVDELGDEAAADEQTTDDGAVEAGDAAEVDERERGERSEQP